MKILFATVGALALTACSSGDRTVATTSLYREAGSVLGSNDFGNSTMNNNLVHRGELTYTINLSRRFAAEVPSTINFPFNSTALDGPARETLREQANWIRQFPEVRFKVYGHTDLVGTTAYNRNLGLRRAQAVVLYLTSQGISRSRLEAVVSFGETQPLVVTDGMERRNRRTVTEVSGFVEDDPLVLDGRYAEVIIREYSTVHATSPSTLTGISGSEVSTAE